MTSIFQQLFDTYGDSILREHALYDETEIMAALDKMPLNRSTKIDICDLFSSYYFRWSTAAFSVGLHLGLSLAAAPPAPLKNS